MPATVGILDGKLVVGLDEAELRRFGDAGAAARKAGARDLAACCVQGAIGATTVGCSPPSRPLGIEVMATGGLGGVHREFWRTPDVSSDLSELARTRAVVVSCGVKLLLDVPATSELLETLGIPVLGYRTDTLPLFYTAAGGPPVSARVDSAGEAAEVARPARTRLAQRGGEVSSVPHFGALESEPRGHLGERGRERTGHLLGLLPGSENALCTTSVPVLRSALRSTRAASVSPSRNGST